MSVPSVAIAKIVVLIVETVVSVMAIITVTIVPVLNVRKRLRRKNKLPMTSATPSITWTSK